MLSEYHLGPPLVALSHITDIHYHCVTECNNAVSLYYRSWYKETSSPVNKDIVVVFDRSNSMKGERMRGAQNALKAILDSLGPNDRVRLLYIGARHFVYEYVSCIPRVSMGWRK